MSANTMPMITRQPGLGALLVLELAAPFEAIFAVVEMDGPADLALSLLKVIGQGAVPVVDPNEQLRGGSSRGRWCFRRSAA